MNHFPLKTIKSIQIQAVKEALSGDNVFEVNLESNLYSLYLKIRVFEVSSPTADDFRITKYEIALVDCNADHSTNIMKGDWEGLTMLKTKLAEKVRQLNLLTEIELLHLCHSDLSISLFRGFPVGHNFEVTFKNGRCVKAVKVGNSTFAWYDSSKSCFVTSLMTRKKKIDDFPVSRLYAVHSCIYNRSKIYIIKRENFNEVTVYQLVLGKQVGKAKFTDDQLRATFEGIEQSNYISLNTALITPSSVRLYNLKSNTDNWRNHARNNAAPKTINFTNHIEREKLIQAK